MQQLAHLLRFDFMLLQRNKVITISALVTAIYIAVFRGLSGFDHLEKLLVLVIFNDPALLGFLFVGVMLLFEQNENTLQALAVTPVRVSNYIISKAIALTSISLICCYAMAIASYGVSFQWLHFTFGTILTTLIFSMLGFITVAGQTSFNKYILRALGVILFLTLPFLGYFEVVPRFWFVLFPTLPAIMLYDAAFAETVELSQLIFAYVACLVWVALTYYFAKRAISKTAIP